MLKNACVNNAVCPGLKIALPTNRGRSHFLFAIVLSVYDPFIEVSGMTGATFIVFFLSFSLAHLLLSSSSEESPTILIWPYSRILPVKREFFLPLSLDCRRCYINKTELNMNCTHILGQNRGTFSITNPCTEPLIFKSHKHERIRGTHYLFKCTLLR